MKLHRKGLLEEALSFYQKAVKLNPNLDAAYNNMGAAQQALGRLEEAIFCFRTALKLRPDNAEAYCNLGNAYQSLGRFNDAIFCYKKTIERKPENPEAYNNMGAALKHLGRLEEAVNCHQKCLEAKPEEPMTYNNLGSAYKEQGRLEQAISCYRKACSLNPGYSVAHSNLILAMQYSANYGARDIFAESVLWAEQHVPANIGQITHGGPQRHEKSRLKIGYVSPDFREHSVSYFFLPLLGAHDRSRMEIFCYAEVKHTDAVTAKIKSLADHLYSTVGLSDEAVAQKIREDGIHILVDLAGHTSNNRLLVFARKPAPVQISWLGYPGTTGLTQMDYRLTDETADSEDEADQCHTETLIRLSNGFLCYGPPENCPPVTPLPSLKKGALTFGSFNNIAKLTEEVVALWSRILHRVPDSSLVLKSRQLTDGYTKDRYLNLFEKKRGAPEPVGTATSRQYLFRTCCNVWQS